MIREGIICISIVILILVGNFITQNYIEDCVIEISKDLDKIKEEMKNNKDNINKKEIKTKVGYLDNEWRRKLRKLAYFIEHTELEKVDTSMTELKSYIDTNSYEEAMAQVDKGKFILKHIEEKYDLNLQNIF